MAAELPAPVGLDAVDEAHDAAVLALVGVRPRAAFGGQLAAARARLAGRDVVERVEPLQAVAPAERHPEQEGEQHDDERCAAAHRLAAPRHASGARDAPATAPVVDLRRVEPRAVAEPHGCGTHTSVSRSHAHVGRLRADRDGVGRGGRLAPAARRSPAPRRGSPVRPPAGRRAPAPPWPRRSGAARPRAWTRRAGGGAPERAGDRPRAAAPAEQRAEDRAGARRQLVRLARALVQRELLHAALRLRQRRLQPVAPGLEPIADLRRLGVGGRLRRLVAAARERLGRLAGARTSA